MGVERQRSSSLAKSHAWNRLFEDNEHMKKPKSFGNRIVSAFVLLSFVLLSAQVFGQNASLSGTVTDETQGVLPGATVTAVNEGTGTCQ